ncbi:hypothetical protein BGZ97_002570 [Linnemannia gamsii]|uniref:ENTH domain-containing protein n=1 Tax=Linnemannia gamsii TaxID=64522 RepID=A0A9P6QVV3_9FUNG|nr:hypothetical protein BGZ97_002570 [Linnemannia gamsii]
MEKAVVGATKPKCMYPKQKYIDTLLFGATTSMHNIMLIMNALQPRLSSNTWTTSFKSLLVIHLLTRSDAGNDVLSFCASQRGILSAAYKGGANSGHSGTIRTYAAYLIEKIHVYGELKRDPVRTGVQGRDGYLKSLSLSKGLLHHVAALQKQIAALLSCKFYVDELSNEVTIGAFALLVQDLLRLFQAMNEGVINILRKLSSKHYFEMTKDQARLGLQIYKTFAEQTTKSMEYFSVAKRMEGVIHITIPQLKHAPLSLVRTLEDYLNSPDFEEGQQAATKQKEVAASAVKPTSKPAAAKSSTPSNTNGNSNSAKSGKDDNDTWANKKTTDESKRISTKKDMIDFFSSIDNEETTIQQNPNNFQAQLMTGGDAFQQFQLQLQMQQQQFLQMQQQQQIQQQQMLQSQFTGMPSNNNMFQTDMVMPQQTGFSNTNPFAMGGGGSQSNLYQNNNNNSGAGMIMPQNTGNPFRMGPNAQQQMPPPVPAMPMMTGMQNFNSMPTSVSSQPTGSTNPFAPSANPLNPFSPNFGKVPTQPTGMDFMNMNGAFGGNNNSGMVNSNPTGAGNPWGQQQQQQQQQTGFGHQGSGSFM